MYGVNLGGCEVGPGYNGPTSFPTAFHSSLVGRQALQTCKNKVWTRELLREGLKHSAV